MQLSRFVEALRNDLAAVAELGDEQTAEAARRIAHANRAITVPGVFAAGRRR